jgi:hypothetical protein
LSSAHEQIARVIPVGFLETQTEIASEMHTGIDVSSIVLSFQG